MDATRSKLKRSRGVIERYREYLPVSESTPIISLGEGDTPLIYCPQLSKRIGRGCDVFVKNEGVNPTCSFKDRGMTVAVSKAIEHRTSAIICASTGNTSASAAAYAARAGISSVVVLPAEKIASGKLLQAFAYGAKILAIDGNFDDALRIVRELGKRNDFAIVNSINPDRIAGQKTAAFEIVDVLGDAPDFHLLPLGNAGNITAYWLGYREYQKRQRTCPERQSNGSTKLPVMVGFQAAGAAPIFKTELSKDRKRLPLLFESAICELETGPRGHRRIQWAVDVVSDEEIIAAQIWLARHEGIFVEPASAAAIAGFSNAAIQTRLRIHSEKSRKEVGLLHRHGTRIERSRCNYGTNGRAKSTAATVNDVQRAIGF